MILILVPFPIGVKFVVGGGDFGLAIAATAPAAAAAAGAFDLAGFLGVDFGLGIGGLGVGVLLALARGFEVEPVEGDRLDLGGAGGA